MPMCILIYIIKLSLNRILRFNMNIFFRLIDRIIFKIKGVDITMVDKERDIMKAKIAKQQAAIKAAQEAIKPK